MKNLGGIYPVLGVWLFTRHMVKNEEVRVQGFQADLQLEEVQEAILPDSGLAPQKENKL